MPPKNKFISYGKHSLDRADVAAVTKALKSGWLSQGPEVQRFEEAFAKYCQAKYAVAVSSGTAGLHLACLAAGLKAEDRVLTTPLTFAATTNALLYCGARPSFCDIRPDTLGMNLAAATAPNFKAVLNVHFSGQPNPLPVKLNKNFFLIEDACHALGAEVCSTGRWKKIGSSNEALATVFSFHPVKHITTGEGGMVVTNDKNVYNKVRLMRSHGMQRNSASFERQADGPWYYEIQHLGYNYRMSDIQCALGLSQLKKICEFVEKRKKIAHFYDHFFKSFQGVHIPPQIEGTRSSYHLYILQIDFERFKITRRIFVEKLAAIGIGTQVHYVPLYRQPYYRRVLGVACNADFFPETELYYRRAVSIPIYPSMTLSQISKVANGIQAVLRGRK